MLNQAEPTGTVRGLKATVPAAYTGRVYAVLVLWDLSTGSKMSITELRTYIREESMARFREMPGLRQKTWISDDASKRWGALYIFETRAQADDLVGHIATGRVARMTGLQPAVQQFEVEAVVEGQHSGVDLLTSGRALLIPSGE